AQAMHERSVAAGETLFRAGDAGDSMFIVKAGKVELFVKDTAGQKIVLHVAEPPDHFGELSLLDGGSRTASATILEAGQLLAADRAAVPRLLGSRPDPALAMLAPMGRMTRTANALLEARVVRHVNEDSGIGRGDIVLRAAVWVPRESRSIALVLNHVVLFA